MKDGVAGYGLILQLPTCVWATTTKKTLQNQKPPPPQNTKPQQNKNELGIMGKFDFQLRFQEGAMFLSFSSLRSIYSMERKQISFPKGFKIYKQLR